jgi:prephenate dehydratase
MATIRFMTRCERKESLECIAYQGEPGAYSEEAIELLFGKGTTMLPRALFQDVFTALASGAANRAVLPVENSTTGSVLDVYDLLAQFRGRVVAEVYLPVNHCLMAVKGVALKDVRRVISHPQALSQCQQFLSAHQLELSPVSDTAGAARWLAESNDPSTAVLASRKAAELYGLEILASSVQDSPKNTTRFLAIVPHRLKSAVPAHADKTSLIFETKHSPGALVKCLARLAEQGVNLTKIESRPIPDRPWEYRFFLDFLHAPGEEAAASAIGACASETLWHKVLGTYVSAISPRKYDVAYLTRPI